MSKKVYQKPKKQGFIPPKKDDKKVRNKKIAGRVLILLMIFWTLCSFLSGFLFVKDSCVKTANADSVAVGYKFNSSNIYTVCSELLYTDKSVYDSSSNRVPLSAYREVSHNRVINFRFNCYSEFGGSTGVTIDFDFVSFQNNSPEEMTLYNISRSSGFNEPTIILDNFFIDNGQRRVIGLYNMAFNNDMLPIVDSSFFSGWFEFYVSPNFNANVVSARYYGERLTKITSRNVWDCANYFYYYDENGEYLQLTTRFKANEDYQKQFIYSDRSYYLTSEATTQTAYNLGKKDGFSEGQKVGYDLGYEDGHNSGYSEGKYIGRQEGIANANKYSFVGLMSSIVDAPVTAIKGLFNFDFLGFNLFNFFTSVLTVSFVIAVVRYFL